jgi:hypothetical protein
LASGGPCTTPFQAARRIPGTWCSDRICGHALSRGTARKEDCRRRTQQDSDDIADCDPSIARCSRAPMRQLEFVPQSCSARMDEAARQSCVAPSRTSKSKQTARVSAEMSRFADRSDAKVRTWLDPVDGAAPIRDARSIHRAGAQPGDQSFCYRSAHERLVRIVLLDHQNQ